MGEGGPRGLALADPPRARRRTAPSPPAPQRQALGTRRRRRRWGSAHACGRFIGVGGGWGGGSRPRLRCARALLRGPGGLRGGWGACAEGGGGLGWWSVSVRPSVLSLSLSSGAPSYLSRQPWGSCLRLGWYSWRLFFGGGDGWGGVRGKLGVASWCEGPQRGR